MHNNTPYLNKLFADSMQDYLAQGHNTKKLKNILITPQEYYALIEEQFRAFIESEEQRHAEILNETRENDCLDLCYIVCCGNAIEKVEKYELVIEERRSAH